MRRLLLVGTLVVMLAATSAALVPVWVGAQNEERRLEQVERDIANMRRRITTAESDRTAYAEAIVVTESRMAELKAKLWDAEDALTVVEAAVAVAQDAVIGLIRRIRLLDAELARTRLDQRLTEDSIRHRAVEMYMSGSVGVDTLFIGSWDPEVNTVKLEYTRNLLQDTEVLLLSLDLLERQELTRQDQLREEQEQEATLLKRLEVDLAEAEESRAAVEAAREEVRLELEAQEALLAQVKAAIEDYQGHVAGLEAESKEIELEILRRQVREGRAPGRLAWPVGGRITSPFGWRIHPILGQRLMHNGIDLGSNTGEPIHAAANGVVILSQTWGGYGRTVVIDHGGGLSTLYGHQSSIRVSVGDEVLAGDVIGNIGCTGYCTGPHLHFEVREVGRPVDPLIYLPK